MATNLIVSAAQFADAAHHGQVRKYNGGPYITHPMRVAGRACLLGMDETDIAIAWLHDVIEDCGKTRSDIAGYFSWSKDGWIIAHGVQALTDPSREVPNLPRGRRKAIDRRHCAALPRNLATIKALDRIDNLREMLLEAPADFLRLYADESIQLFVAMRPKISQELFNEATDLLMWRLATDEGRKLVATDEGRKLVATDAV